MACPPTYQGILQFHWLKTEGVFLGGGGRRRVISGAKVAYDLLLDERRIPGKFGSAGTYGAHMHKEQTNRQKNKHSSLYFRQMSYVAVKIGIQFDSESSSFRLEF